jgi:hypothetical protein
MDRSPIFATAMLFVKTAMLLLTGNLADRRIFRPALAVIVLMAASMAWGTPHAEDISPPIAASAQQTLPAFRYVRTLPAPNEISVYGMFQSGTSRLTWSPDGERLAAYIRNGLSIITWSPDGKYQFEFPRYTRFGLDAFLLGFLSGHSQIISSPAAESKDLEEEEKVEQNAFSVMDAATGKLIQGVPGPNPGKTFRENIAKHQAISPDQQLVAVIYHPYAGGSIGVYSTRDWQRIAAIDIGEQKGSVARALAFSPDGRKLAIARGFSKRVDLFEVGSWKLLRSIEPFPEKPPPMHVLSLGVIAFSPDGTMIAVGSASGGSYWKYPNGNLAPIGVGLLVQEFPPDPLRVFRVDDGSLVASAAGFPGGITDEGKFAWSPTGKFIAFLDTDRQLRLWSPAYPAPPTAALKLERSTGGLVFSPNGEQLAINFANGVKIFDVIAAAGK